MNWLSQIFVNIFRAIFNKTDTTTVITSPPHIVVEDIAVGMPTIAAWKDSPITNPTGVWDSYVSLPYGNQEEVLPNNSGTLFEDNCTLRMLLGISETEMNYKYRNKLYPQNVMDFFTRNMLNADGYVKLSARFSSWAAGVKNGTGVSVPVALASFVSKGVVPEHWWPELPTPYTFEQYVVNPPANVVALGAEFATLIQIAGQQITPSTAWGVPNHEAISEALTTSPVGFASSIGNIDQFGVEQYAGIPVLQHCRFIQHQNGSNPSVVDNYPIKDNFIRNLSQNFPFPYLVKIQTNIV